MSEILGSNVPHSIGEVVTGCYGPHGEFFPHQRFVVVRESTRDAWRSRLREQGVSMPRDGGRAEAFFYEVLTD